MDEDEHEYDLWECIAEHGKVVYSHSFEWNSSLAHPLEVTGEVIQYQDAYYWVLLAEDAEFKGPYAQLEQAIRAGELHLVSEETREIETPLLGEEELQSLLVYNGILPHTILVNGRKWHSKAGHQVAPAA